MKTIWVVLFTVIISGGLVGGGIYYYEKNKIDSEKSNLQTQIDTLNTKINDQTKTIADLNAAKTTSPTTTTTTTTDPTATWKTYAETTVGYSIKYPTDYRSTEIKSTVIAFGPSAGYDSAPISIDATKPVPSQTLDTYIKNRTNADGAISGCQKLTLADKPAYECMDLGMTSNYVVITANNGYIFTILFNTNKDTFALNKAALTTVQKNMLASFLFTK